MGALGQVIAPWASNTTLIIIITIIIIITTIIIIIIILVMAPWASNTTLHRATGVRNVCSGTAPERPSFNRPHAKNICTPAPK